MTLLSRGLASLSQYCLQGVVRGDCGGWQEVKEVSRRLRRLGDCEVKHEIVKVSRGFW